MFFFSFFFLLDQFLRSGLEPATWGAPARLRASVMGCRVVFYRGGVGVRSGTGGVGVASRRLECGSVLCASLASRCPRSRLSRARRRRARLPAAPRASPCSCSSPSRRPRPRPAPLSSSPTRPASTASSPKTSASTSSSPSGSSSTTMTSKCQVSLHTTLPVTPRAHHV